MIIITKYIPNNPLVLEAFSFNPNEFIPLENVLNKSVQEYQSREIPNDLSGRPGRAYRISHGDIHKFEEYLGVRISSGKIESDEQGHEYRCEELNLNGNAIGCETFHAKDMERAKVKCSMTIAPKNGWFSGEAEQGACKKKKSFW